MEVGAERVQAPDALEAVGAVVAVPVEDAAERLRRPRPGGCARRGSRSRRGPRGRRPGRPRSRRCRSGAGRARGRSPGPRCRGPGAPGRRAGSSSRAAGSRRRRRAGRSPSSTALGDRVALGAQHVLGDQHLVAVLAAADVDQVVVGGIEALARARRPCRRSRSRATRSAAAGRGCSRGRRRCSSARGRARAGAAPGRSRRRSWRLQDDDHGAGLELVRGHRAAVAPARRPARSASCSSASGVRR